MKLDDRIDSNQVELIAVDSVPVGYLRYLIDNRKHTHQFTGTEQEQLLEFAGRECYKSVDKPNTRSTKEYIDNIVESRHTSVLGHGVIYFKPHSKDELMKFMYEFRYEPGWYVHHDQNMNDVLTVNQRLVERKEYLFFSLFPEIHEEFVKDYPLICKHNTVRFHFPLKKKFKRISHEEYTYLSDYTWLSFWIHGTRSFSHEWIRHSYQSAISQRSTRYVDEHNFGFIPHPVFEEFPSIWKHYERRIESFLNDSDSLYFDLVGELSEALKDKGMDHHTARKTARGAATRFLPHGLPTDIVYSCSVWELKQIFSQRISDHADLEIKVVAEMASDIFNLLSKKSPVFR